MKHKPVFKEVTVNGKPSKIYLKEEHDDHFLFKKTMAISINAKALEMCDYVGITLHHRGVKIMTSKDIIKAHKEVRTFHGEVKYYLPVDKWKVKSGKQDWFKDLEVSTDLK